jgi:predicted nucleic-acid-binding Zn-ribbon protein
VRKTGICPKCQHDHTLLVARVADTGEYASDVRDMELAVVIGHGFFGGEKRDRAGVLSAVVCQACGFTELYVADPGSIPIDGTYVELRAPAPKDGPLH